MRKIIIALSIGLISASCNLDKKEFVIHGNINGIDQGIAVLQKRHESRFITIDSVNVTNGKFKLSGSMEIPELCYIWFADTLPPVRLMLENSTIQVTADALTLNKPVIEGSQSQKKLEEYQSIMNPYDDRLQHTYDQYQEAEMNQDLTKRDSLEKVFENIMEEQKVAGKEFVIRNSDNVLGPYILWGTLVFDLNLAEIDDLTQRFSPDLENSVYVQQLKNHIATLKRVDIGQPFTDITMEDPSGNLVSLSSLKGKIILVDFWASWCGPCRKENPNVVKMYREFKDKGFEIFGVSFDKNGDQWIEAIQQDSLEWIHVSDLKGWESEGSVLYGVRSIPHTVLIGRDGIIIDKNLRGDKLKERIRQLINT